MKCPLAVRTAAPVSHVALHFIAEPRVAHERAREETGGRGRPRATVDALAQLGTFWLGGCHRRQQGPRVPGRILEMASATARLAFTDEEPEAQETKFLI